MVAQLSGGFNIGTLVCWSGSASTICGSVVDPETKSNQLFLHENIDSALEHKTDLIIIIRGLEYSR
jgi:hypothetical protein